MAVLMANVFFVIKKRLKRKRQKKEKLVFFLSCRVVLSLRRLQHVAYKRGTFTSLLAANRIANRRNRRKKGNVIQPSKHTRSRYGSYKERWLVSGTASKSNFSSARQILGRSIQVLYLMSKETERCNIDS